MKKIVAIAVLVAGCGMTVSEAKAQFIQYGPNGSVGIRNGAGTYTWFYPQRLNPWANVATPGSYTQTPNGDMWLGLDGQVHGNAVDPATGDMHAYSYKGAGGSNGGGFIPEKAPAASKTLPANGKLLLLPPAKPTKLLAPKPYRAR